jgi:predicted dehydrogenase
MKIGVVLHGVTGRMGDVAYRALRAIGDEGGVRVGEDRVLPVPIGLGRDATKLAAYARKSGLQEQFADADAALARATAINRQFQIYHNAVPTGARHAVLLAVLPELDPATTGVFCERPIASNYAEGWEIVQELERGRFVHGVVHGLL